MIILLGPFGPKSMAEALVASENVGDGGPGDVARFGERANERSERARGMVVGGDAGRTRKEFVWYRGREMFRHRGKME